MANWTSSALEDSAAALPAPEEVCRGFSANHMLNDPADAPPAQRRDAGDPGIVRKPVQAVPPAASALSGRPLYIEGGEPDFPQRLAAPIMAITLDSCFPRQLAFVARGLA